MRGDRGLKLRTRKAPADKRKVALELLFSWELLAYGTVAVVMLALAVGYLARS